MMRDLERYNVTGQRGAWLVGARSLQGWLDGADGVLHGKCSHQTRSAKMTRRVLVCVGHLVLVTLATRAHAQAAKVSSTGKYQVSLTCGGGVADAPGPNGENYTSAGVNIWDTLATRPPGPTLACGAQPVVVGGTGVTTMEWLIFVFDKAHALVKQCESQRYTPVSGGRFSCKAAGNTWATLSIKPQ